MASAKKPNLRATGIRPIWLASYPRSGNTFLRIILQNLFRLPTYSIYRIEGAEFPDPSAEALEEAPFLPREWAELLSDDPHAETVLIKTHNPPRDGRKAIYLVRDGRASINSYFHYHKKFAFEQPSLTEVIVGACQFGSWSEHYLAWQPKTRPETLWLRYEDLVSRPAEFIPVLAKFIGATPLDGRLPTFAELKERMPAFFRRGQNNDFASQWSPGQQALFNLVHGPVMQELGYALSTPSESALSTVPELARSAARSHKLYIQQLERMHEEAYKRRQLPHKILTLRERIKALFMPEKPQRSDVPMTNPQ